MANLQITQLSSVQSLSGVWLCDPMDCSTPGLPVHHQLPEPTQTHVHWVDDTNHWTKLVRSLNLLSWISYFNRLEGCGKDLQWTSDGLRNNEKHRHEVKWSEVAQSCPTLCNPMDYSLQGSSVHGIFQARVLEWVAISSSRGSSRPRDWTWVSRIAGKQYRLSHQESNTYTISDNPLSSPCFSSFPKTVVSSSQCLSVSSAWSNLLSSQYPSWLESWVPHWKLLVIRDTISHFSPWFCSRISHWDLLAAGNVPRLCGVSSQSPFLGVCFPGIQYSPQFQVPRWALMAVCTAPSLDQAAVTSLGYYRHGVVPVCLSCVDKGHC